MNHKLFLISAFPKSSSLHLLEKQNASQSKDHFKYMSTLDVNNKRTHLLKYINLFFFQASARAGILNLQIWLANHAHVTGLAFYDTA